MRRGIASALLAMRRHVAAIGFVVSLAACAATPATSDSRFELFVLGTAQDGGRPHLGCDAPCCTEMRASGDVETPVSLGVHDRVSGALLLIEATPAIESQVALLQRLSGVHGRARHPVDAILATHAHIGHYLGLAQLGREVASTDALPLYVTPRFAAFLRANGPWSQLVQLQQLDVREIEPGRAFEPIAGLSVEAIVVPHRDEYSDTVALRLRGPKRCVLFVPDVDGWDRHPGLLETLLDGVDVAYVDGTFYDGRELPERKRSEIPHPTIVDTMERCADRAQRQSVRFIHLNHTNPLHLDAGLRRALEERGFTVAAIGERCEL